MRPKVKTARNAPIKRRFATFYYTDLHAPAHSHVARGACSTIHSAVGAIAIHLALTMVRQGKYRKAIIHDRVLDADLAVVRLDGGRIDCRFHDEDKVATISRLRRVK